MPAMKMTLTMMVACGPSRGRCTTSDPRLRPHFEVG